MVLYTFGFEINWMREICSVKETVWLKKLIGGQISSSKRFVDEIQVYFKLFLLRSLIIDIGIIVIILELWVRTSWYRQEIVIKSFSHIFNFAEMLIWVLIRRRQFWWKCRSWEIFPDQNENHFLDCFC